MLSNITFQALEACFEDTDFGREILEYPGSVEPESITEREALSIIRIALRDPDHFDSAVELHKIDYRDLFMAAEHGQLASHLDRAASVIAKPPKSNRKRAKEITAIPDKRGIIKCPKCDFRLEVLKPGTAWDGIKHKRCGQRLNIQT